jgi:hypothetical protein
MVPRTVLYQPQVTEVLMKVTLSLAMAAFLVMSASAGVKVDHEAGVDFDGYHTFAWRSGTEAARPQVQQWIVSAVDRELKARGMRKVSDRRADLYVVTHAYAEMGSQVRGGYLHLDVYDVGLITSEVVDTSRGLLMVDLIDGESERPVWRGLATEVMGNPSQEKLRKKVDKVVRKMFKGLPGH